MLTFANLQTAFVSSSSQYPVEPGLCFARPAAAVTLLSSQLSNPHHTWLAGGVGAATGHIADLTLAPDSRAESCFVFAFGQFIFRYSSSYTCSIEVMRAH